MGDVLLLALVTPTLVRFLATVGFCLVPGEKRWIFEILVPKVFGMSKSAKIELCVICRFSLEKKDYRSDEPASAHGPEQIIEWSDFVGPVAGCDANFEAPARELHRF